MSSIYKELVESFGYTAVMEAVSLDTIMAAVGQEKDEQKRAATLNDIAWKENLPGLYDPVSGYFVRKQSMPARSGARYDIAATGSNSADKELADKGLIPDSAKTSTAIGRMVRGDDKGQYDQDIRTRNQANKPSGQSGQPSTDSKPLGDIDIGFGPNQFTPGDNKPAPDKPAPNKPVIPGQGGDMDAKRRRYAELLAKAKNGTVPSGSRM